MADVFGPREQSERPTPDVFKEAVHGLDAELRGDLERARADIEVSIDIAERLRTPAAIAIVGKVIRAGIERRRGSGERSEEIYLAAVRQWEAVTRPNNLSGQLQMQVLFVPEAAFRGDAIVLARCREVLETYEGLITING